MSAHSLFDFSNDKQFPYYWIQKHPTAYKGRLLPSSQLYGISGFFGQMLFQCKAYKNLAIWYNTYNIRRRMKTHARLDRPSIELSLILKDAPKFSMSPFSPLHAKAWQFNIIYAPYMDNKTQFESITKATTVDIHFDLELLQLLYADFSDLVGPLLDSVYSGKPVQYFSRYLYASPAMAGLIRRLIHAISKPTENQPLIEFLACHLLLEGMRLKAEKNYCPLPYDEVLQIQQLLDLGIDWAMQDMHQFWGSDVYAAKSFMSNTTFKKYMQMIKGRSIKSLWKTAMLDAVLEELLYGQVPVKTIAHQYGFLSQKQFRLNVVKRFGYTPAKLRSLAKGQPWGDLCECKDLKGIKAGPISGRV